MFTKDAEKISQLDISLGNQRWHLLHLLEAEATFPKEKITEAMAMET